MNDLAMQKDRPSCRNKVRELPVIWLGHQYCANLLRGLGGLHPVKVDARLVSFALSGVRKMTGRYDRSPVE